MTVNDSTLIRIPLALKAELEAEAAELLRIHEEGRGELPPAYVEHVPIHYVITKALEDMRAKRVRSRAPKRPAARKA
jgi:hypothetical protein